MRHGVLDLRGFLAHASPALPEGVLDLRVLGSHIVRTTDLPTPVCLTYMVLAHVSPALPGGVLDLRVPGSRVARTTTVWCARLTRAVARVSSALPNGGP